MAIIIGLDLSLTATGVVVITDSPKASFPPSEILDQLLIESSAKEETTPRVIKISTQIMKVVSHRKPNLVVIEGPALGVQKTTSIFTLGELAGLVKANLHVMGHSFIVVPPTTLKKWVTGKGNCDKNLMLLKVYKRFGVEFSDDNLCDAYALAKYGFQFIDPKLKNRKA